MTTDEMVQYDPRTKMYIKDKLFEHLYGPVQKRFDEWLEKIIIQNTVAIKSAHKSFTYKGELYSIDDAPPPRRMNRLAPQFHEEMKDYIKERDYLNNHELPYVLGFINSVLNSSNYFQDYLRVFPEPLHGVIRDFMEACPCNKPKLTEDKVEELKQVNSVPIELIKKRMVQNLII